MDDISATRPLSASDVAYHRQRQKNRMLEILASFFAEEARRTGVTKKQVADALGKDPAQITRWLSSPGNLTLDTISDLLLALGAEMDHRIVRFAERPESNEIHPLVARVSENAPDNPE